MLTALAIRNVVLIDALDLEGAEGLCALTGETGAGKSILLDALSLALGARADSGLVRHSAAQASVSATFELPKKHPVLEFLREKGIETEGAVILRRVVGADGRGKAFINDTAVSVQLLKETGQGLVEIHGQFDTQGLLDPATHRAALDGFANVDTAPIRTAWGAWRAAETRLEEAKAGIETMRMQEQYLQHASAELEKLDPKEGEEDILAEKRSRLMNAGKLREAVDEVNGILESEDGIFTLLGRAQVLLEKAGAAEVLAPLARAKAELEETGYALNKLDAGGAENLEQIEDRYFALRASAKKHRTTVDGLVALRTEFAEKLRLVTDEDGALDEMEKAVAKAKAAYAALAETVSVKRAAAAGKLSKAVQKELPDLKLEKATFAAECTKGAEKDWGPDGFDRVQFTVSTNPGAPAGPLHKIASGGELSRFTLALKAVLAATGSVPTLVFDEVDMGVGGGTAAAVGERLARLAEKHQVFVVTHSPQVAARAEQHWHVAKTEQKGTVITKITPLVSVNDRQEEIARMLSGATVTKEARAAAAKLLEGRDAA